MIHPAAWYSHYSRDASQGNALYRAPGSTPPPGLISTNSPILGNSSRARRVFAPTPSNEVMIYSPILSQSRSWQNQLVR